MELTQSVEPTLEQILAPLVERRQALKAEIALRDAALDSINDEIKTALLQAGELEIVVADHRVTLDMERQKSTLVPTRLLELGVSTDQITKATKVTTHIQLDVRKAAKGDA